MAAVAGGVRLRPLHTSKPQRNLFLTSITIRDPSPHQLGKLMHSLDFLKRDVQMKVRPEIRIFVAHRIPMSGYVDFRICTTEDIVLRNLQAVKTHTATADLITSESSASVHHSSPALCHTSLISQNPHAAAFLTRGSKQRSFQYTNAREARKH